MKMASCLDDDPLLKNNSRYPSPPVKPLDSDCCGSGCTTCVFNLYDLEVVRWQQRCDEIDGKCCPLKDEDILNVYEYKPFIITKITQSSCSITSFTFQVPESGRLPLQCGQHIVAKVIDENGKIVVRPYTPVNPLTDRGSFEITCKLYEKGEMSQQMRKWKVGDTVQWRGPFGQYQYEANKYGRLLCIAGGTGITPIIQVIRKVLYNEDDFTRVHLLYSVQHPEDIILREEWKEWASYWNFDMCYCVTGSSDVSSEHSSCGPGVVSTSPFGYGERVNYGRIDEEYLRTVCGKLSNVEDARVGVLICGSKQFNEEIRKLVLRMYMVDENDLHCFS